MKKWILLSLSLLLLLPVMSQTKTQLPAPNKTGGMPLMEALSKRATNRDMDGTKSLTQQQLSDMLWAAWGVNRPDGRRTSPSALNKQVIELYVIGRKAAYRYDHKDHSLVLIAAGDHRSKVNTQDYVKTCDYIVIFAADNDASIDAGFISQNIYLYCASAGLANVVHGTLNKPEILKVLKLPASKHLMLGHSVGIPK